jgi:MFS family permease
VSFYILPALLAGASARRLHRKPVVVVGVLILTTGLLLAIFGNVPMPIKHDQTWSPLEVGSSRLLVNGQMSVSTPSWLSAALRAAAVLALTLFVTLAFSHRGPIHAAVRTLAGDDWALARAPLLAFLAGYLVLTNLLWMYHDRYYLALAPPIVALLLGGRDLPARCPRHVLLSLLLFGSIALVGTRDALRFNQAVRDVWQSLVDAGERPANINGGYAWNGWLLYAHPSNLDQGMSPLRDVPWVTSARRPKYTISTTPLKGYAVERSVSWRSLLWPGSNRLFVLRPLPSVSRDDIQRTGTMH